MTSQNLDRDPHLDPSRRKLRISTLVVVLFLAILVSLAWQIPAARGDASIQTTPGALATPTAESNDSPVPNLTQEEWATNFRQTDGIVFGGVLMVLVIVGGTLYAMRRKLPNEK